MSERKVLTKYYPPDFDPSKIERVRKTAAQAAKLETVRLMAPFSMKCTTCGEYIYKGRKFNARKELTGERYHSTAIIRFYIRCTRCSAQITFKTDPQNEDFECERGAKRNFEPWRDGGKKRETQEEVLDRLQREEAEENERGESDAMGDLERKMVDSKQEMAVADALDEIRTRNALHQRMEKGGVGPEQVVEKLREKDEERVRQEREDEEAARRAFATARADEADEEASELVKDEEDEDTADSAAMPPPTHARDSEKMPPPPVPSSIRDPTPTADAPTFGRAKKRKRDFSAALGIKKKVALV